MSGYCAWYEPITLALLVFGPYQPRTPSQELRLLKKGHSRAKGSQSVRLEVLRRPPSPTQASLKVSRLP